MYLNQIIRNRYTFKKLELFSNCCKWMYTGCPKYLHRRPDFSKNTYNVERGYYNYLQDNHIKYFQELLGEKRVIMDLADLEKYNVDWFLQCRGSSSIVLRPKTTDEVSEILKFCNKNKLAVCPQGGNTSVVGGSVPVFDEIIVSTELMNEVINIDEHAGVTVCQSGCVLENLDNSLEPFGLMVPIDLGARGTCQIGGCVATNAGGMRLLRYGNLHGNVLGLEVVKANGEILDCLNTLKKDNTGFHLKNLFIGSEGSLGFITKVAFQCPPKPRSRNVAFLGCQSFDKILKTFRQAKKELGEILSAVEVLDSSSIKFVNDKLNQQSPIGEYPFYLLIETSGSNEDHDNDKMEKFLANALNTNLVLNGTTTSEPNKVKDIWSIRDKIPDGFKKCPWVLCYDISLPLDSYYTIVEDCEKQFGRLVDRIFGFGHLGDGNLHIQFALHKYNLQDKQDIEDFLFKRTAELGGSISAEHGMGFLKAKYLYMTKPVSSVKLMRQMKRMLDPNHIMNPYKVFP